MSTLLNYWHYVTFFVFFLIWIGGIIASLKQEKNSVKLTMVSFVTIIVILFSGFSVVVVDKYTKFASLHKLKNKRLLSIEKTIYTGIVRNDGKHTIGEVSFEIKLVNKGHVVGSLKGGAMYKPSGFLDFFSGGSNVLYKPQTVTKEFVVAKNLKPGQSKAFRVYFDYPPYFRQVSFFTKLYMH